MMLHPNNSDTAGRLGPAGPNLARHSKRKALAEAPGSNERLSKRLSLLNLDNSGAKAFVPAASSQALAATPVSTASTTTQSNPSSAKPSRLPSRIAPISDEAHSGYLAATPLSSAASAGPAVTPSSPLSLTPGVANKQAATTPDDDDMHVDNTKYKVYIYNIDDELADDEAPDSDAALTDSATDVPTRDDTGKLVFLSDIDKHLRAAARDVALTGAMSTAASPSTLAHRKLIVPRPILPNKDGELAGKQLVLYNDPSSLSVPRENDSVRQAIIEARARIRERQQEEKEEKDEAEAKQRRDDQADTDADVSMSSTPIAGSPAMVAVDAGGDNDPDAMDID